MTRRLPLRLAPLLLALVAACESTPTSPARSTGASHQGFDAAVYPGDAAMRAWRDASPYQWAGYYLPAPCHHDVGWSGRRATLAAMGWGLAALYVGQQTWEGVPDLLPTTLDSLALARADRATALRALAAPTAPRFAVTCSRTLLSTAQGESEGRDAAALMASEGFAAGSVVYLDVEYMTTIPQSMRDYVAGWIGAVLADGRYAPGVYVAKRNADELRAIAQGAYAAAHHAGEPRWWITTGTGFDRAAAPRAVGLDYASVWQGLYDRSETWGGATATIDVNVADRASPSAP